MMKCLMESIQIIFILDSFLEKYPIYFKFGQFVKINLKTCLLTLLD